MVKNNEIINKKLSNLSSVIKNLYADSLDDTLPEEEMAMDWRSYMKYISIESDKNGRDTSINQEVITCKFKLFFASIYNDFVESHKQLLLYKCKIKKLFDEAYDTYKLLDSKFDKDIAYFSDICDNQDVFNDYLQGLTRDEDVKLEGLGKLRELLNMGQAAYFDMKNSVQEVCKLIVQNGTNDLSLPNILAEDDIQAKLEQILQHNPCDPEEFPVAENKVKDNREGDSESTLTHLELEALTIEYKELRKELTEYYTNKLKQQENASNKKINTLENEVIKLEKKVTDLAQGKDFQEDKSKGNKFKKK